ncbi:hypothetical protein [Achromobacter spanius]|uniref:Uncharacterized protein n=1 Tax=Achromobacter spanius TaxID=217203 RepID=A0AAW3I5M4_9BURK|nr:hypothetical protein [Achromobacter spanius]KNE28180.1 hypothetical protein AFM18_08420 [Achromobacter spanius]
MREPTPVAGRRELRHIPVNLPRAGFHGERIYLDLWREYLGANRNALREVFGDLCEPLDQRGARVAASFMVWMGCNAGQSFTYVAERLAKYEGYLRREEAFVAAWAIANLRNYGVNSGIILTEAMLTPGGVPRLHQTVAHAVDWRRVYSPTQYDNDVLSCMVRWWAGSVAGDIREAAQSLIEAERKRERAMQAGNPQHPRTDGGGRE